MVAINFMPQFEKPILDGTKIHTLRDKARAKVGDKLQLYTGQRTKACRLIKKVVCVAVAPVKFEYDRFHFKHWIFTRESDQVFALNDGFSNYNEMCDWFMVHKEQPWSGYLIAWGDAPYLANPPHQRNQHHDTRNWR